MKRLSAAALSAVALLVVAAAAGHGRHWHIPDRFDPFAPLVVNEVPNWLTRYKLSRLTNDAAMCRAVLRDSGAAAEAVADHDAGTDCGWTGAVRLRGVAGIGLSSPAVMSCRTAVSLALWTEHVVQPAAWSSLGQPVRRIEHLGSYACRNVNGAQAGRRSRHANAEALDVAAFTLRDGSRLSVLRDWRRDDGGGRFLHQAHDGACRWFDGALGPDFNRQHVDHFHLERGGWSSCR